MYLKQKGEEVYSKPLHMCGTIWKLKVYPVSVGAMHRRAWNRVESLFSLCRMDIVKTLEST